MYVHMYGWMDVYVQPDIYEHMHAWLHVNMFVYL